MFMLVRENGKECVSQFNTIKRPSMLFGHKASQSDVNYVQMT